MRLKTIAKKLREPFAREIVCQKISVLLTQRVLVSALLIKVASRVPVASVVHYTICLSCFLLQEVTSGYDN